MNSVLYPFEPSGLGHLWSRAGFLNLGSTVIYLSICMKPMGRLHRPLPTHAEPSREVAVRVLVVANGSQPAFPPLVSILGTCMRDYLRTKGKEGLAENNTPQEDGLQLPLYCEEG